MTVIMETSRPPMEMQEELAGSLEQLLHAYLAQLGSSSHGGQWSQDETALVRHVRDTLVRAGYNPRLSYDVINHIDSPVAGSTLPNAVR